MWQWLPRIPKSRSLRKFNKPIVIKIELYALFDKKTNVVIVNLGVRNKKHTKISKQTLKTFNKFKKTKSKKKSFKFTMHRVTNNNQQRKKKYNRAYTWKYPWISIYDDQY